MATVDVSPEIVAEIQAEDAAHTEPATEADADAVAETPAQDDAPVDKETDVPADTAADEQDGADLPLSAVRQIEFYFADANLPYDKFMWTLHTANPDHWVPVKTVASFKRMREFAGHGTDWLVNALRTSDALEVDESGENVRRRTEVTEPKGQFERSIYAKGFGEEVPGLQQKLESFFNQYGRTNAVRMRREDGTKLFKGSVFVEFDDMTSVEKFLNADPKPTWSGEELLTMSKEAYCEMKIKEKGLTGKAAVLRKESIASGQGRKGFNAFKEMAGASGKGGKNKSKDAAKPEVWLEFLGHRIRVHDEDGGTIKDEDVPFVKGASLKFDGVEGDVSFDEIKGPLKERFPRSPFVQYNKGDTWGLVGFDKVLSEDELAYVKEHVKALGGKDITWHLLDEETEKSFQLERATSAAKRALHFSQRDDRGGGGRGRGGRGGRGARGGRGRGRGGGRGGDRNRERQEKDKADADPHAGDKRKRAVEPDGGPDTGVRGQIVPLIQSAKKAKTDGEAAAS